MKGGGKKKCTHGTISNIYGGPDVLPLYSGVCRRSHRYKYVVGHVFTQEEVDRFWNDHTAQPYVSIESTVKLNRNTTGFQGTGCGYFTADAQTVTFVITNAPGASTYNVGLFDSHGNAVSDWFEEVPMNNPVGFRNLIVGEEYHFVVSSNDVPERGCTANYEVY